MSITISSAKQFQGSGCSALLLSDLGLGRGFGGAATRGH